MNRSFKPQSVIQNAMLKLIAQAVFVLYRETDHIFTIENAAYDRQTRVDHDLMIVDLMHPLIHQHLGAGSKKIFFGPFTFFGRHFIPDNIIGSGQFPDRESLT